MRVFVAIMGVIIGFLAVDNYHLRHKLNAETNERVLAVNTMHQMRVQALKEGCLHTKCNPETGDGCWVVSEEFECPPNSICQSAVGSPNANVVGSGNSVIVNGKKTQ